MNIRSLFKISHNKGQIIDRYILASYLKTPIESFFKKDIKLKNIKSKRIFTWTDQNKIANFW